eukprot:SAG11_NODE_11325_length_768_cov_1.612855_2_plen_50_part_01
MAAAHQAPKLGQHGWPKRKPDFQSPVDANHHLRDHISFWLDGGGGGGGGG